MTRISCAGLVLAICAMQAHAVTLVKDGKPTATIVISDAAFKSEPAKPTRNARYPDESKIKLAALELQTYVKRMTGAELSIASDAGESQGAAVLVGKSKRTNAIAGLQSPSGVTPERAEEGFVIRASGDTLVLAGNDQGPYHGTFYAVGEFLKQQGVRWILPGAFGEVVPAVLNDFRPNLLANYLYELANSFHAFYEACPVLKSDEPSRSSRLALCELTGRVLAKGLDLLGIKVPERM